MDQIHTPCRNCVFAQYDGNTQTGCQLGRIEAFRQVEPSTIIECQDGEKEFFVVNGRGCGAYRPLNSPWADIPGDYAERVRREIELQIAVVAIVDTLDGIDQFINSLLDQTPRPVQVFFVNRGKVPNGKLHAAARQGCGADLTWRLTTLVGDAVADDDKCVEMIRSQAKCSHAVRWNSARPIPTTFFASLNKALNEDMARFSFLRPNKNGDGYVAQWSFYTSASINGNQEMNYGDMFIRAAIDKAEHYGKENDKPYIVQEVTSLCPDLA